MKTHKVWLGAFLALGSWMGCTSMAGIDGVFVQATDGASGAGGQGGTGGDGGAGGAGECTDGAVESCYEGSDTTMGMGACAAGQKTCFAGQWGACEGQVLPTEEVCNGSDDDCDGEADEDISSIKCGVGACTVTVDGCKDGVVPECTPLPPNPSEVCEGIDDNCNGQVDEGCSCTNGQTQPCYTGSPATRNKGICVDGTQTCINGIWGGCDGEMLPEDQETCDGLDNDCDQSIDEEIAPTTCGVGACQVTMPSCENGQIKECVPGQPSSETCNAIDDDCNGQVDEALGNLTCGTGECNVVVAACSMGTPGVCVPKMPVAELCDGKDNDCNGTADNGNPGGGLTCNTGLQGICAAGTTSCTSGAITCDKTTQPKAETCNNIDDDCDGMKDDNLGSTMCGVGACMVTQQNCVNGQVMPCTPKSPIPEVCNNIDDDCDGTKDDGNPGGGVACNTGKLGVCAAGTTSCTSGAIQCVQTKQASPELCNNLDDDCDGMVDEGVKTTYYKDNDGDGFGNPAQTVQGCSAPAGYVGNSSDCNDNNSAIKPGATDLPDDSFVDSNCDGIDGTVSAAVFVAKAGSDTNAGTKQAPVATLTKALALATNDPLRKQIYISEGVYSGRIKIVNGISMHGAYSEVNAWARSTSYITTIESLSVQDGRMSAVEGFNITSPTTIDRLTIRTGSTNVTGVSNYAMYCSNCGGLRLKRSILEAGNAGPGLAGMDGTNGSVGSPGGAGGLGDCSINAPGAGGSAGGSACGWPGGNGGHGGYINGTGEGGFTPLGGASGGPGGGTGNPAHIGANGGAGSSGENGVNGAGGGGGSIIGGFWVGAKGAPGTIGGVGYGGGGAGGGGGENWSPNRGAGNGGGGGGGGGCPGTEGLGGTPGGSSLGLLLVGSIGVIIENSTIKSGTGGSGGSGGDGGTGGVGGVGGLGGTKCLQDVGAGGNGGAGGTAGRGGHGGGGEGGYSIAFGHHNSTFSLSNTTLIPGTAGVGGFSLGNSGTSGIAATQKQLP